MSKQAYPLSWPDGWKRTPRHQRTRARFGRKERQFYNNGQSSYMSSKELSVADSLSRVLGELETMGIRRDDVVISSNLEVRLDGLPRSNHREPEDPGVAVYWQQRGKAMRCMAIDRYYRTADNLAAIAATLDAMRAIERHGGAAILDRAFTGFAALPEKATQAWRQTLGIGDGLANLAVVEDRFRALVKVHHPDAGGDPDRFQEIMQAREAARLELSA